MGRTDERMEWHGREGRDSVENRTADRVAGDRSVGSTRYQSVPFSFKGENSGAKIYILDKNNWASIRATTI